jgi:type IV pilus assembly protein PilN
VGVLVVLAVNHTVASAIQHQDARNNYLKQQITVADKQIKQIKDLEKVRTRLLARIQVIKDLQKSRSRIVHFFDQTVATLPNGVYLTALKQDGGSTALDGIAQSNGRVSNYLRNLDHSGWFSDPSLVVISSRDKKEKGARGSKFTIKVKNTSPSDKKKEADKDKGELS